MKNEDTKVLLAMGFAPDSHRRAKASRSCCSCTKLVLKLKTKKLSYASRSFINHILLIHKHPVEVYGLEVVVKLELQGYIAYVQSLCLNLKIDIDILKNPGGSQRSCERVF